MRELLRTATGDVHARLERRIPLLDPSLDRAAYARILAAMLGVYRPLERRLAAYPIDGDRDRRVEAIARDLAWLGRSGADIDATPDCDELPIIDCEAAALGSRYVLEGAALGGAIIARHIVPRLSLAEGGASFFVGYGPATAARWTAFVERVDRFGRDNAREHQRAIRAAQGTFFALERWLDRCGVLQ